MRPTAIENGLVASLAPEFAKIRAITMRMASDMTELDAAARDVVDAVNQLQQAKHTRAEIAARRALERRALALRAVVRKRDERS